MAEQVVVAAVVRRAAGVLEPVVIAAGTWIGAWHNEGRAFWRDTSAGHHVTYVIGRIMRHIMTTVCGQGKHVDAHACWMLCIVTLTPKQSFRIAQA